MLRSEKRRCVFRGDHKSMDVKKFFLVFENVIAKKIESPIEKARELLLHLEGPALDFFYKRFAEEDKLSAEAEDFRIVKDEFYKEFAQKKEPDVMIREAIDLNFSDESLVVFVKKADAVYREAGFNEEAKFRLLSKAVQGYEDLWRFLAMKSPESYVKLRKAIVEFERLSRMYGFSTSENQKSKASGSMDPVMEELTSEMSKLVLQIKTLQKPTWKDTQMVCSFCKKEGHIAAKCDINPDKDKRCSNCSKMGHSTGTCWVKKGVDAKAVGRSRSEKANAVKEDASDSESLVVTFAEPVAMAKREHDGQPMQKSARMDDRMPVRGLIDTPVERMPPTVVKKKKKNSKSKKGKVWDLSRRVEKYDLLDDIAQAPTGLTFGQLVRGDAEEAQKELKNLLVARNSGKVAAIDSLSIPRRLRLVEAQLELGPSLVLFDSGSAPNILSRKVCDELGLKPKETDKKITVASGDTSMAAGWVDAVAVRFGDIKVRIGFLVIDDPPFGIIVGLPTMEALGAVVDTRKRIVTLEHKGVSAKLGMVLDIGLEDGDEQGTDSDDFTSEEEADESGSDSGSDESKEELVLAVRAKADVVKEETRSFPPSSAP